MNLVRESALKGCYEIEPSIYQDNRGTNIKIFNSKEFGENGIHCEFKEDMIVVSKKNVLRGLHFQKPPFSQGKLVLCIHGEIMDIAVDLRIDSPTYGQHAVFYLSDKKYNMVYIPEGFAHGYLVLSDSATVTYKMTNIYAPEFEGGILWNSVDIDWPIKEAVISAKDLTLKPFKELVSPF